MSNRSIIKEANGDGFEVPQIQNFAVNSLQILQQPSKTTHLESLYLGICQIIR